MSSPSCSVRPTALAIAAGTSRSPTTVVEVDEPDTPGTMRSSASPTAIASRVFPEPPTAVIVTDRCSASKSRTRATPVAAHQTRGPGRQVGGHEAMPHRSGGKAPSPSWNRRSGSATSRSR